MESQETEIVELHEEAPPWIEAVLASVRPSDHHVTDEDVYQILTGDGDDHAIAALVAAKGVTVPMYCVWKAKYRHLALDELRKARGAERRRARAVLAVGLAAAIAGAGGLAFALTRVVAAKVAEEGSAADVHAVPSASAPGTPSAEPLPRTEMAFERRAPAIAPPSDRSAPPNRPPVGETGYRIQVAAATSAEEGRAIVAQLASAGYPAYLLPATVASAEVFRVRIGPFDTLPAAEEIVLQLKRDGHAGAWIAR